MSRGDFNRRVRGQKGVALVQVIITTSIILLLAIYYLGAAKNQVARAKALQDKTDAYMLHYSANSKVLFTLLTSDYHEMQQSGWNFFGQSIQLNEHTTVQLQDLNGLLSLASLTREYVLQKTLARHLDGQQSQVVAQSMMDWIDADHIALAYGGEQNAYQGTGITVRNGPIQTYSELAFINGMTYEAEQVLLENTTVHPTPFFNPITAPVDVLAAFTDGDRAQGVMNARGQSNYNRQTVEEITMVLDDETVNYLAGPGFRLTINAKVGESFFGKTLEYGIYPYRERPIEVLSRLPRQQVTRLLK